MVWPYLRFRRSIAASRFSTSSRRGVRLQPRNVIAKTVADLLEAQVGRREMFPQRLQHRIDPQQIVQPLAGDAHQRCGGLRTVVQGVVCHLGGFLKLLHVLQDAPLILEGGVFVRLERRRFNLLALEAPEVQQPQLLLLAALDLLELGGRSAPLAIDGRDAVQKFTMRAGREAYPTERVQHVALRFVREQELLVVLAVDIRQVRRQFAQQRRRHRPAPDEGPALAARQDLAFHQQLAVFNFDARRFQQTTHASLILHIEDAGHTRARFAGADHFGGGAGAQQEAQRVHHDGFAAAGFAGEEVEAGVEVDSQALDYGVVLDHEFQEHGLRRL